MVQATGWRCVWGDALVYVPRRLTVVVTLRRKLARSCETRDSDCATLREKQEASLALPGADLTSGKCRAPGDAMLRAAVGQM